MLGEAQSGAATEVARISLRLPPFWKANVRLWLAQCDNSFAYSGIVSDCTKYSALVAHIDAETLSHVSDLVLNPPTSDKYAALSTRLISEFEDSEHQKVKKLLTELQLDDERPSHLLRKMKELSGNKLSDEFLQSLWLQRMPAHIQTVLSASSAPLDKLAAIADKVSEISFPTSVCAATSSFVPSNQPSTEDVMKKIEELSRQVAKLSCRRSYRRNTSRSRRPRSNSRSGNDNAYSNGNMCYYHKRFGDRARKCSDHCEYTKKKNGLAPS